MNRFICPSCQSEDIKLQKELGHDYPMGYFDILILTCKRCGRSNEYCSLTLLEDGEIPPGAEVWTTAHPRVP